MIQFATEARISLISTSYDYAHEIMDTLLENYFLHPRYLHVNDVIRIDAREYAQDQFYTSGTPANPVIYFIVKSLRLSRKGHNYNVDNCYVVRGISTLIQEAEIHSYIPRKHIHTFADKTFSRGEPVDTGYPSVLVKNMKCLESCITPFMKNGKSSFTHTWRYRDFFFYLFYSLLPSSLFYLLSPYLDCRRSIAREADIPSERTSRLRQARAGRDHVRETGSELPRR